MKRIVNDKPIGTPEEVLRAALLAPRKVHKRDYAAAVVELREKGYSWRKMSRWFLAYDIDVSVAHLRRLYLSAKKSG